MKQKNQQAQFYTSRLLMLLCIFMFTGLALSFALSYSFSLQNGRSPGRELLIHSDILYLFIKQVIAMLIGIIGMSIIFKMKTDTIRSVSFTVCILGLIFMFITVLWGTSINGARRWLSVFGVSVQTGDFVRIGLIVHISHMFAKIHALRISNISETNKNTVDVLTYKIIVRAIIISGLYILGLYFQRDYSSLILTGIILLLIIFSADIRVYSKLLILFIMGIGVTFAIINDPNRMKRVLAFINSSSDAVGMGFQISQSRALMQESGFFGNGVGNSMLDAISIPYFYNDFVFSVIVSEFGIPGALCIVGLFLLMFYYAYKVCFILYYRNRFYFYVVFANAAFILLSVIGHISVAVGIAPTAGINMPFYSTGGSSLITTLFLYACIVKGAFIADNQHIHCGASNIRYSDTHSASSFSRGDVK